MPSRRSLSAARFFGDDLRDAADPYRSARDLRNALSPQPPSPVRSRCPLKRGKLDVAHQRAVRLHVSLHALASLRGSLPHYDATCAVRLGFSGGSRGRHKLSRAQRATASARRRTAAQASDVNGAIRHSFSRWLPIHVQPNVKSSEASRPILADGRASLLQPFS
jgi:hypothetical protein